MGTVVTRTNSDGSTRHRAQIVIKQDGKIIHRESRTFTQRPPAERWIKKREKELRRPGGIPDRKDAFTLGDAIKRFLNTVGDDIGRSRLQVLNYLKDHSIANEKCEDINSERLVQLFEELSNDRQPQTVTTYASGLSSIFSIAQPAWGMPLDPQAIKGAIAVGRRLRLIGKAKTRDRRPTLNELNQLLAYFEEAKDRYPDSIDMVRVIVFAIFSARRQEEITRITREDFDQDRILVRDMKDPGRKKGNDVWCQLPDRARDILTALPDDGPLFFPVNHRTISARFTRACHTLDIQDLRFHDLRHEGASWLAELGWTVPQIAGVTGHRGWQGLQRYSHVRKHGDKYEGWEWLGRLGLK